MDEIPLIIGQTGPFNGHRWEIKDSITIGRDADCDIVIADRQISRYHARFTNNKGAVILEDLASKNGTFCNGKQVDGQILLKDGDLIQIAMIQHFVFLSSDATLPLEMDVSASPKLKRGLTLEKKSHRVWIDQLEVIPPLSLPQFKLLEMLVDQEGKVVTRQDLISNIWEGEDAVGITEQALDALVRRLRDRLIEVDPDHSYITTVRGHGLRLDNPE
ncbi:MAG: FHA domain-containing protein [Chloroflexi bacterium]|nr:FHA domain-containing protein [Chloroflexota bacterium]